MKPSKTNIGRFFTFMAGVFLFVALSQPGTAQQKRSNLKHLEGTLKPDVPNVMCVNHSVTTGGQPTEAAYKKLAHSGYKCVLNLRTANEGVDLKHEQELIEKSGMKYINIPVSHQPNDQQVIEFIKVVRRKVNHPMLIHCTTANRVGAFWMIYRVVDQGWTKEKAFEEAKKIGLTKPDLMKFVDDYLANHKPHRG